MEEAVEIKGRDGAGWECQRDECGGEGSASGF